MALSQVSGQCGQPAGQCGVQGPRSEASAQAGGWAGPLDSGSLQAPSRLTPMEDRLWGVGQEGGAELGSFQRQTKR